MLTKSLRFKINAAILMTCLIIVVIFWSLLYPFEMNRRNARFEEIETLMDTVFRQKRDELANELFAGQRLAMEKTLDEMKQVKGIVILSVYDLDGNVALSTEGAVSEPLPRPVREAVEETHLFEKATLGGRPYVSYATLIQVIGEKVGYLRMHYDLAEMERESTMTLVFFGGLLLSTLVIMSLFLNIFLSRSVIRPASVLRDAIRKVQGGHLGEQVDLPRSDEIGEMASDFNHMSNRLEEQHIALTDAIEAKDAYAARLEESNRELETLNTRLEDMVKARTAELQTSNEQLQQEINDRKRAEKDKMDLEEKLARSQKMEALGLLAGGVAHDLNNVLSGIVSYPDLLLLELPPDSAFRKPILTIQDSGQKAAAIVQDLLTLARRGVTHTEILNLNEVVRNYLRSPESAKLETYHPDVRIETSLDEDLLNIQGSPVHLRKTLMNLVSNAAEAQPGGGTVRIYTRNRYVDRPVRGYDNVQEGEYVVLGVADEGAGIAPEEQKRIFEPFYTKKVMGRSGTGLGMAVVWGTVQDHQGYIDLASTEGQGSTFELYFPISREAAVDREAHPPVEDFMGEGQTVLVVDDVKEQREIATVMLRKLQYEVATVSSGEEALAYLRESHADVLVLDMIMDPGMDGLETYREIGRIRPGQKAVIASGFAENERVKEAQALGAGEYVKKPYTVETIGLALKRVLANRSVRGPHSVVAGERPPGRTETQ